MITEHLALDGEGPTFTSRQPTDPTHIFGGLVVAQALGAATATVPRARAAHSLHASFLTGGTPGDRIAYDVERTRDGSSFTTRRVVAHQGDDVLLVLTASFHVDEPGLEYELPPAPDVPAPEDLPAGRYDSPLFTSRDAPPDGVVRRAWLLLNGPIGDDPALHLQVIAFLSDFGPTRAAREPHASLSDDARRMSVTLDHSVWFHRPVRVDQWLLSELEPRSTGRGRGLSLGSIRTGDGTLVASTAQEVLLRERSR